MGLIENNVIITNDSAILVQVSKLTKSVSESHDMVIPSLLQTS